MLEDTSPDTSKSSLRPARVPLYYQIEQEIRLRIEGAEFEAGAPLPTEDQICEQYGVSRITVRRALDGLHRQRLIVRRQGVGSFVAEKPVGIYSRLTGSLDEFLSTAASLRIKVLSLSEAAPPAEVRQIFTLERSEGATLLKTIGSLEDGSPVAYLEIWFPLHVGNQLRADKIDGSIPVVQQVERMMKLRLTRAEQLIEPDQATSEAARHLNVKCNSPVLRVKRVYYAIPNRPIEIAYVHYHPKRYRFAIEFKT